MFKFKSYFNTVLCKFCENTDLFADFLHSLVRMGDHLRAFLQFRTDLLAVGNAIFFVAELMLRLAQKSAMVRICTSTASSDGLLKKDRHLHNQVKASIAVRLWIFDIVLDLEQADDIVLAGEPPGHIVNVVQKIADHANACHIVEFSTMDSMLTSSPLPLQFIDNT